MLDYALPLENITSEIPKQDLNFHVETVYNDGVDPRPGGGYTDSDWTHVMMGVSTDFDLGSGLIFTPGLFHQITMEDDAARASLRTTTLPGRIHHKIQILKTAYLVQN